MKNILIIDDSKSIRQVVNLTLKSKGYNVIQAVDGVDAISKLEGKIHLIICDINMPKMDGLTFLKKIKTEEAYANYRFTPVIMLTTVSEEEQKNIGQEAGAKAWIVKPFLPEKLLQAVEKLSLP